MKTRINNKSIFRNIKKLQRLYLNRRTNQVVVRLSQRNMIGMISGRM